MIKFTQNELNYVKKDMERTLKIFNGDDIKKLREYIENIGGQFIDTVLLFSRNDWIFFDLKAINKNTYFNKKIEEYCVYGIGMFCFGEKGFELEELENMDLKKEYIDLYEKIYLK